MTRRSTGPAVPPVVAAVSSPTTHAVFINTGSISMPLHKHQHKGAISAQVAPMICKHTCYAFDWCRPFCLFSVNFCQSIPILDVDYVLFSKRNAPEISSCGGDHSPFFPIKEKHRTNKTGNWQCQQVILY